MLLIYAMEVTKLWWKLHQIKLSKCYLSLFFTLTLEIFQMPLHAIKKYACKFVASITFRGCCSAKIQCKAKPWSFTYFSLLFLIYKLFCPFQRYLLYIVFVYSSYSTSKVYGLNFSSKNSFLVAHQNIIFHSTTSWNCVFYRILHLLLEFKNNYSFETK